jgi:dynein heavy chain
MNIYARSPAPPPPPPANVLQVVAAMGPPGGARNPVDPRFISMFNVFEIQFPSTDNLRTIYQVTSHSLSPCRHYDSRAGAS